MKYLRILSIALPLFVAGGAYAHDMPNMPGMSAETGAGLNGAQNVRPAEEHGRLWLVHQKW